IDTSLRATVTCQQPPITRWSSGSLCTCITGGAWYSGGSGWTNRTSSTCHGCTSRYACRTYITSWPCGTCGTRGCCATRYPGWSSEPGCTNVPSRTSWACSTSICRTTRLPCGPGYTGRSCRAGGTCGCSTTRYPGRACYPGCTCQACGTYCTSGTCQTCGT